MRSSLVVIPHLVFAVNRKRTVGLRGNSPRMGKGWGVGFVGAAKPSPQTPLSPFSRARHSLKTICCTSLPLIAASSQRCGGRKWGIRGGGFAAAPNPPLFIAPRTGKGRHRPKAPQGRFPSPQLRNSQGQPFCGLRRGGNRARISIGISTTRRSSTVPSLSRPKNRRRPIRVSGGL